MPLSLFHQHAKTKRHWAQHSPDKLLEILKKTEGGEKRKKEDFLLATWDLRSACVEWGAIKLKELSGRRNFEPDTHLDLSKTIKAFMRRLPKGPELDAMISWEKEYQAAYEAALYNEGTSIIWAFLADFRDYDLPQSWLEEFHKFCLRWPWELEIQDAIGELRNAIQASLLEAKAIAKKPLVHDFDDRRFSLMCMILDQFDAIFQLKLFMQASLDAAGVFMKFTEKDVETFADFEASIRQIDFGGAMPAIGRWIRYCRITIDLDRYCTGYAWDFITFCAHMVPAENFIWLWDVNENFDQHRLDKKLCLAKTFIFELQRLISKRFPTGYECLDANQEELRPFKEMTEKDNDSDGSQNELTMLKRKPFFVQGDLLVALSSKAGIGKDIKKTFRLFGKIFQGWVDDMARVLSLYKDKNTIMPVSSKSVFDGKLGPFEIKVHKPLHFVLLRFVVFLYEEDVDLPLGLKHQLKQMTVKYTDQITETSESVWNYIKQENADILVIPNMLKLSPVRLFWFKTLSELISRAVELEHEDDVSVAAHTEAPTEPAPPKIKVDKPESDTPTTAQTETTQTEAPTEPAPPKIKVDKPESDTPTTAQTETTQTEQHNQPAKSESDTPITDQVDESEKAQSHQAGQSNGPNISRDLHELDQPEAPEIMPTIDHTDHVTSDHTYKPDLSVLVLNQPYINNSTSCDVPPRVVNREPPQDASTGPSTALPPDQVGNAIQSIVDYSRNTAGDIHVLHEEIYSLRALVTMLIDGDARSRRILMERGHLAVPFAQMRTDPTLDRSSIFSQTGGQYAATLIAPPAPDGPLEIADAEFYS
ncbi:uncharacterized protein H6S33_003275 [Morchella sextelata]|uniref:uncharacterized protein n=1 Tax=Morchella sextelata TaxID=1174677 RepID=UPI001D05839E|nr:uncharacterized protein H6S33_003275 [Morchella sextelata]KAH0607287.1 hypothetical protein H6S33_003275 [Morchella sextelata]